MRPSDAERGTVAEWVRALAWTGRVRIPLRQLRFGTLAILFTPLCKCLSEETLKAVGPFYLVSMPGILGQISNNVPGKSPVGIFEEKGANNFL